MTPEKRFKTLCREAVRATPKDAVAVRNAIWELSKNDIDLLCQLYAPYRQQALELALKEAAAGERLTKILGVKGPDRSGGGQASLADRARDAAPTPHPHGFTYGAHTPASSPFIAPRPAYKPPSAASLAAITGVVQASLLDSFKVNGQSIGDVTAREAMAWAGSRERDARFVRMLTENLPQDQPIRKFRTPEEAASIYSKAEKVAV